MQDGINVQAGKILNIHKLAGWNKAVQDGIFHFSLMKIHIQAQNFPNLINVQAVQDGIIQKINKICCMIIRETRVLTHFDHSIPI